MLIIRIKASAIWIALGFDAKATAETAIAKDNVYMHKED